MVKVRPEAERMRNYRAAAALVPDRFESGINRADWQSPSLEGQALYVTQLSKADVLARRAASIAKVSDSDFRSATIAKGKPIIRQRMEAATEKQSAGYRPFASALESLTLTARTDDSDTNIDNRVKPIAKTMIATKKQVKGW